MKPIILHISNDYPDSLMPDKTRAIINLVEGSPQYRHVVYSLNRVNGWSGLDAIPFGEDRIAVAYGALPKGLFWEKRLGEVADWISADLKKKKIVPDAVEAHKFTVEGLIGQQLAKEFSRPLICDIQGNTDVKILKTKIGLRGRYRAIAQESALIFPFAPWMIKPFKDMAGMRDDNCVCLPVIPGVDDLSPSAPVGDDRLISVFNLDRWKIKNLDGLLEAVGVLAKKRPDVTLDVYGRGSADTLMILHRLIQKSGQQERIRLMGGALNGDLPALMKNYAAFVLPTLFETYGLVFAEALFAGLPVLLSKNRGIDGYLDTDQFGYACDPTSVADIAKGLDYLLANEARLKQSVAAMQAAGQLDLMRQGPILKLYQNSIDKVLAA